MTDILSRLPREVGDELVRLRAENADLRAKLEWAAEALEPFAEHADFYDDCEQHPGGCPDSIECGEIVDLTVGDFRLARTTLSEISQTKDGSDG